MNDFPLSFDCAAKDGPLRSGCAGSTPPPADETEWVQKERSRPTAGFIGGYLIEDGAINLADLDRGLDRQLQLAAQGREMRLGEVLIEMGVITREQLERALARQAGEERQKSKVKSEK